MKAPKEPTQKSQRLIGGSFLADWSVAIRHGADLRAEAHARFQETLGLPSRSFTEDDQEFGMWRVAEGVLVIPKRANGYHSYEQRFYSDDWITALIAVREEH